MTFGKPRSRAIIAIGALVIGGALWFLAANAETPALTDNECGRYNQQAAVSFCQSQVERAMLFAHSDDAKCQSYGAKRGTPPYIQCRTQLDVARTRAH